MSFSIIAVFGVVFTAMVLGTLYAFYWAAKNGQMERLDEAGMVIFNKEDHLGELTDSFPGNKQGRTKGQRV